MEQLRLGRHRSPQLPVNTGFPGRGKRQGAAKLWGPATVRQSRKAGEGERRVECDARPLETRAGAGGSG